ncbi:MAG: DNA mismatch repair endonuclease MutL [Muribaculaceae bacterium]|nr:DNA mismatch repair endonuclease MutL [Muribaculaceae bacterium]
MNDVIKLLPDSVANQIAAGEVIQRPASVIKELVENAVDAGATDIRIYIKDAGRTLIQVIDNGCGMSVTDARMAFERHATSKIRRADDLFTLHTMGFRGEALPSICAISQVEVRTMRPGDNIGTRLLINASKVESQSAEVCEIGTSIAVRNIFFNVPARRKFLKSDNVELSNILREFERLALVNNNIRMSIDTGSRKIELRAATFKQRIEDLWKNNLKMELLPVEVDTSLVKIEGYISRPENARRRNALQYLIVNDRNMRHPYFHKAVVSCYDGLIASDTQPCYFLKFTVDPSTIDVNIHPTKNEIKFEYESDIWPLLTAAVKAALGKFSAVPSIDFESDAVQVQPLTEDKMPEQPEVHLTPGYTPFGHSSYPTVSPGRGGSLASGYNSGSASDSLRNWDTLYSDFMRRRNDELPEEPEFVHPTLPGMDESAPARSICLQYADKYIITPTREGLMIIDQYRAHVKILYERYFNAAMQRESVAQGVMFPESIELAPELQSVLADVEPELARLGFSLEYVEGDVWHIVTVPASLREVSPGDVVLRLLESVSDTSIFFGSDARPVESILQRMSLAMARSAAIRGGRRLSTEDMEEMVAELFALPDPAFTPNGNPVYKLLDESAISRLLS